MDAWVVAAAAGAGCIAKYCQNLLRNRNSLSELSHGVSDYDRPESPLSTEQLHSKSCPFRRLARTRRKKIGADVSTEGERILDTNFAQMSQSGGASMSEVSSIGGEHLEALGNGGDCNVHPSSSLKPGLLRSVNLQENEDMSRISEYMGNNSGDLVPEHSIWEMEYSYGSSTKRSSLRYKMSCSQILKPVTSLESCLMAQLYEEQAEIEEYVLTFLRSPSVPTVRPLLVTDGSRIISRAFGDSFSSQVNMEEKTLHKKPCLKEQETVIGVPKIESSEIPGKMKHKRGRTQHGRLGNLNKVVNGKHFHSQGSIDGSFLFCLGVSIGIISAVISNKREVNKLTELLTHTENLVQDLQNELEMKDSLTVKELVEETFEPQNSRDHFFNNNESIAFSPQEALYKSRKYDDIERRHCKAEDKSESLSKIEAELEAELEMLELSVNSSSLKTKLSDLFELDPEFEADLVQGELGAGTVGGQAGVVPDPDEETSDISTTHSTKYEVSPRELTLRLHEVIQSRLEERIKELETALNNSQSKVRSLEFERRKSCKEFSNNKPGFSSTGVTPMAMEEWKRTIFLNQDC